MKGMATTIAFFFSTTLPQANGSCCRLFLCNTTSIKEDNGALSSSSSQTQ